MREWPAKLTSIVVAVSVTACVASPSADGEADGAGQQVPDASSTTTLSRPADVEKDRIRLAAVGDTGTGTKQQARVAAGIDAIDAALDLDGLVLLGDMIYPDGDVTLTDERILEPYADVLDGDTELFPVVGNHDARRGEDGAIMARLGRSSTWYASDLGPIGLIVLDSTRVEDPAQMAWVVDTLRENQWPWTVVALHHPPYSSGEHGSTRSTREVFAPVFAEYGVDVVLAGHDHDYERTVPIDGVTYVVSGAGANPRRVEDSTFTAASVGDQLVFVVVDATRDVLEIVAYGAEGVLDSHLIDRSGHADP